jgi:hypothetical protein
VTLPRLLPGLAKKDGFLAHPFDEAHGVRTSGLVAGRYLKSGHAHDRHATAYYGVAPSVFHALLSRWRKTRPTAPIEQTTFVDVGAGMGRAVLLAAELPPVVRTRRDGSLYAMPSISRSRPAPASPFYSIPSAQW